MVNSLRGEIILVCWLFLFQKANYLITFWCDYPQDTFNALWESFFFNGINHQQKIWRLCSFPIAAVTKHHTFSHLKITEMHYLRAPVIRCLTWVSLGTNQGVGRDASFWRFLESAFCLFLLRENSCISDLWAIPSNFKASNTALSTLLSSISFFCCDDIEPI